MIKSEYRMVTLAANGTADLMTTDATTGYNSGLMTAPEDGFYELRMICTTAGVRASVSVAGQPALDESPVPSGGTIDQYPNEQNSVPVGFPALKGDTVSVRLREILAGTPSVMATVGFIAA